MCKGHVSIINDMFVHWVLVCALGSCLCNGSYLCIGIVYWTMYVYNTYKKGVCVLWVVRALLVCRRAVCVLGAVIDGMDNLLCVCCLCVWELFVFEGVVCVLGLVSV